jgi:hypothetical protein
MKKRIVWLCVVLAAFVMSAVIFADAADDYRVIKNAVKKPDASLSGKGGAQWFKIVVTGKNGSKEDVRISLPVSLVEMVIDNCSEKELRIDGDCRVDIRKIWRELKQAGPLALVEIEEDGETVKIWLE